MHAKDAFRFWRSVRATWSGDRWSVNKTRLLVGVAKAHGTTPLRRRGEARCSVGFDVWSIFVCLSDLLMIALCLVVWRSDWVCFRTRIALVVWEYLGITLQI